MSSVTTPPLKDVPNGYAGLDGAGEVPDARIPAVIARDAEVAASYQAVTERGAASGYGSLDGSGLQPDDERNASLLRASTSVTTPTRAFGVDYQPSLTRPTWVSVLVSTGNLAGNDQETLSIAVGSAPGPSQIHAQIGLSRSALAGGTEALSGSMHVRIPPGWYYRIARTDTHGLIVATREMTE